MNPQAEATLTTINLLPLNLPIEVWVPSGVVNKRSKKLAGMVKMMAAMIAKEAVSDFRSPAHVFGALLFALATLFTCYVAAPRIGEIPTWVALFWVVQLFTAFNGVSKTLSTERRERLAYAFTLYTPAEYFIAKLLYHALVVLILSLVVAFVFVLFYGSFWANSSLLLAVMALGSLAVASSLSTLSLLAAKAGAGFTLLAVLALPLLLPVLLVSAKVSASALDGLEWVTQWKYLGFQTGFIVLNWLLGHLLFPYIWRD